jgi:signal transduction histidine kinase
MTTAGHFSTGAGKPKAYGLKGLQERAKSVGGWLDISTSAGKGTSIILSVPLNPSRIRALKDTLE